MKIKFLNGIVMEIIVVEGIIKGQRFINCPFEMTEEEVMFQNMYNEPFSRALAMLKQLNGNYSIE